MNINVEYRFNANAGTKKELSEKEKTVRNLRRELKMLKKSSKLDREINRLTKQINKIKEPYVLDDVDIDIEINEE